LRCPGIGPGRATKGGWYGATRKWAVPEALRLGTAFHLHPEKGMYVHCDLLVNLPADHPLLAGDSAPYVDEMAEREQEEAEEEAWHRERARWTPCEIEFIEIGSREHMLLLAERDEAA
jgi:hypothetical protein